MPLWAPPRRSAVVFSFRASAETADRIRAAAERAGRRPSPYLSELVGRLLALVDDTDPSKTEQSEADA
jgi:hypothetical protein